MKSTIIRSKFVSFFEGKGHHRMVSSPLIPTEDTTVLLTTAGMQQMMPFFLGAKTPLASRLCSVQKCFRTVDIDEVGDAYHNTFFEMLGNFSVGDYFKQDAIAFAFSFLTEHLGIPAEKLWVTIHPDEDVAQHEWKKHGIPASRIFIDETNFWGPPGETGPCGTDSEIYFDFGTGASTVGAGEESNPLTDSGRFLEIWNLVFMEFFQDKDGARTPLPAKNIDTGMGFERIVRVLQEKQSVYATDIFTPILETIGQQFPVAQGVEGGDAVGDAAVMRNARIIADHVRGATFLAAELVAPSNVGRGYIMRRIIRRAVRSGYLLSSSGEHGEFLAPIVEAVVGQYQDFYPEIATHHGEILRIITEEERNFNKTLDKGMHELEKIIARSGNGISGHDAFVLYDTYGFPLEMTREIAQERSLALDEKGFEREMEAQRDRSRRGSQFSVQLDTEIFQDLLGEHGETVFVGYDELSTFSVVLAMVKDKREVGVAEKEDEVEVVLDKTPFYARAGGQTGDVGMLLTENGKIEVTDTRKASGIIVHIGKVVDGSISVKEQVQAQVTSETRLKTARHHTATHLLHQALREVLGEAVKQAGSSVNAKGLRFDFSFPRKVERHELDEIEQRINAQIAEDLPVVIEEVSLEEAKERGAMALFDGKYGEKVRLVSIGDWSKELCGGTHVEKTGVIGSISITKEESVGGGMRRIRAVAKG